MKSENCNGLSDVCLFVSDSIVDWEPVFTTEPENRPLPCIATKYNLKLLAQIEKWFDVWGNNYST